jgi:RimJ/RimL family protein N-acetyltransferase
MGFQVIRTERLMLRPFRTDDADVLTRYRNDAETARYQSWPLPYTSEMARRLVTEMAYLDWPNDDWYQIAIDHDGALIGDVAVGRTHGGSMAEIGYTLAPSARGAGLATEAVRAVVSQLFAEGVHRVYAGLDPANVASAKLLRRLGFRHEGRFIQAEQVRGRWCDDDRFAVLATEWPTPR